jgi:FkbH-like protein
VKWDDLVSWRINWIDKSENIRSIADELGFALESILFIDDHPVERDRVRHFLPEVEVWGDDMFGLRRRLLGDPRLQVPTISPEAGNRTILTKSRLERERARLSSADEEQFRASLEVECVFANITDPSRVVRIEELFRRTTQFNTSAYSFSLGELTEWTNRKPACMFSVNVSDRFGDQGLVGAAVAIDDEILGIAISCRVLGLGIEDRFIQYVLAELKKHSSTIRARIVETSRNAVVRNIYQDNGFREVTPGQWQIEFQ